MNSFARVPPRTAERLDEQSYTYQADNDGHEGPASAVRFSFVPSGSAGYLNSKTKLTGLAITVLLHALVAGGLILRLDAIRVSLPAAPLVMVNITDPEANDLPETPPELPDKLPPLKIDQIAPPAAIVEQPSTAITPPRQPMAAPAAPSPKAVETYQSKLLRHLNRYKRYPPAAQQRKEQGTAIVSLTMDDSGALLASRLVKSSGYALLDAEALDLLKRANPFPPPPEGMARGAIEFIVPVDFFIR